jgi:hypothetical protein
MMKTGKCQLLDKTIAEYDLVSANPNMYPNIDKRYLGQGYIVEIDGKPMKGNELLYFWVTG